MDKKTILGLGIIGVILAIFTFFNQPSKEELKLRAEQQEQLDKDQEAANKESEHKVSLDTLSKDSSNDSLAIISSVIDSSATQNDSTNNLAVVPVKEVPEESFTLENDNLSVILTNKGGGVKSVFLKKYQTYYNFIDNRGTDKIVPLQLFDEAKSTNNIVFNNKGVDVNTGNITFKLSKQTENSISFIAKIDSGKSIEQIYSIQPDEYFINYEVKMVGFEKDVQPGQVYLDWKLDLLKTERLLEEQRRYSTVFYYAKDSYDYLSEHSDDEKVAENDIDWIAFKQSYFSAIMMPDKAFKKEGTTFKVTNIKQVAD